MATPTTREGGTDAGAPMRRSPAASATDWTLAYVLAGAVALVGVLALGTAPVAELLGDSKHAIPSTLHGVAAMLYFIVASIGAYMAYLLYVGRLDGERALQRAAGVRGMLEGYRELRWVTAAQAFLSTVTILFGNWIYIYYRTTGGPRSYFLENAPEVHEIFFEFKEFIALFTLPLSVAAAYVVWSQGEHLAGRRRLQQAVAVMLLLAWVYLLLTFGLGAAITKLRSV